MLLQLKSLILGETDYLPIDCELDLSGVEWNGGHPFREPVKVKGRLNCPPALLHSRLKCGTVMTAPAIAVCAKSAASKCCTWSIFL